MHSVNNGNVDVSKFAYNPHQGNEKQNTENTVYKVSQGESVTTKPITHRICNSAEGVAASFSAQASSPLSDAPSVDLTKTFYQPRVNEPLIHANDLLMTHADFRDILSKHMDVYAVITDDFSGHGAVIILVIGKPKFEVNDLEGKFNSAAFKCLPGIETPYSSDLMGFSLEQPASIVNKFYSTLTKYSNDSGKMNPTERSIFDKLKPKYKSNPYAFSPKDFLNDLSPQEAKFIFEQIFDKSIEQIKKQESSRFDNSLNSKATIKDLPEILQFYKDSKGWGFHHAYKLNYLDEALLENAKWK
ncbi:hypothetical protein [Endozoicomonas sp. ONNA2]|uniref:hypothetical protein n=1 Tax=Endozoicomonas sp. ONNA2 TaxID=2828741 RepID=UPI0021480FE2|nr:hypothetical protein [Endozoicomonas sp. ONNA2]